MILRRLALLAAFEGGPRSGGRESPGVWGRRPHGHGSMGRVPPPGAVRGDLVVLWITAPGLAPRGPVLLALAGGPGPPDTTRQAGWRPGDPDGRPRSGRRPEARRPRFIYRTLNEHHDGGRCW